MLIEIVQWIILGVVGFAGGLAVAGGVFAFISMLKVIPRLADRLGQASRIYQVETVIALGGLAGSILTVYQVHVAIGWAGMTIFGLFAGVFVGCLAMALAETLKVIPVLCQRLHLNTGLPVVITAMALGKMVGSFVQLMFWRI